MKKNNERISIPQKKKLLRVGVVQMNSGEHIESNIKKIKKSILKLGQKNCDLILFPENSIYLRIDKNQTDVSIRLNHPGWKDLQGAVNTTKSAVLLGVGINKGKKATNSIVLMEAFKKPRVIYNKVHLFDVDVIGAPPARESDSFIAGTKPSCLKIKGWKIGLSICYDVRFSELYQHYAVKDKVDVIVVPAAFLVPTGQAHWHTLIRARAIECQAYCLAPAQSGRHLSANGKERFTYGHSLIVDPWGQIVGDAKNRNHFELSADLSEEKIQQVRRQIPMASHRKLRN